ncbi:MAG: STAS domain-containing protein [Candidatus Omnitrophota bacterium]|nr:MAG: STAS domain-containing protein [Candidatus Omnitrophota bacterium]
MKKKVLGAVGALEIELEGTENIMLMVLSGQIDNYTSEEIAKIINEHISKGNLKIIVDLTKVDYLDSAGLSCLINAKIRLSKRNGGLRLVGLKGKAREVFDLAGLTQMFDIHENREAAFEGF